MEELVGDRTYTLTEAARLTGLSVDALRQRAKRGKVETVKGNDGLVRVRLTMTDLKLADDQPAASQLTDKDQTISALQGEATSLRDSLSREQARADQAEACESEARALAERRGSELTQALVRAAAAEAEAKALREALDEARRPAWRRWLGWH